MRGDAKKRAQLSRLDSIPNKPAAQSLSPREMSENVLTSSIHAFVVILDHELTPATYSETTKQWTTTQTSGVIHKRLKTSDRSSPFDLDPKGTTLLPQRIQGTYCDRRTIYNTTQSTIPSCVPVVALQDGPGGDLYVVQEYTAISESSTTTTTTTSTTTTTANPCIGKCKFVWDGTVWVEEENNCSTTTTTSTSTTSTTSKDPCICRDATTTTTTTTLDPSACKCQYPNFCANEVDECTYTSCSRINSEPNVQCTTSTSTTSTTTSAPCDCGTTTTNPNDCGDCTWAAYNGAVYRYSNCSGNCVCPNQPTIPDCSIAVIPCVPPGDPPPPDPPVVTCSGTCSWTWIGDSWWPESNNCESSPGCGCHPPTFDGSSFCGSVTTNCGVTIPDDDGGSTTKPPCWECYTTTTTSTTSTSTTEDPCSVGCVWMIEDGQWKLDTSYDSCPFSCPCAEPGYAPTDDTCERAFTECGTGTTSTSTSTTTTTTTTCPPRWFCMGDLGSCVGAVCEEHSYCSPPADYCGGPYMTENDCIDSSTFCSTTTSTTTTTTTTPACDQFKWFCVGGGCNSCIADLYCNPGDEPAGTCTGPHNSQAECLADCSTTANPCAGIFCTWQGTNLPPPEAGWTLIAPCGGLECTNCDTPAGVGGSATTTLMPCHP